MVGFEDALIAGENSVSLLNDRVRVALDPTILDFQASIIPSEIVVRDLSDPELAFDQASLVVELIDPVDPVVQLSAFSARADEMVSLEGMNFFPNADGIVQFDDDLLAHFTTDNSGAFTGSAVMFMVPDVATGFHYITASVTGPAAAAPKQFSFQMLEVVPEPTTGLSLGTGLVVFVAHRFNSRFRPKTTGALAA